MLDKKISTPFYARFLELCHENNLSPAAAVKAAGISSGAPTAWKNKNAIPKPEQRQKLCELFKVTDSDLMGYEKQKKPAEQGVDRNNICKDLGVAYTTFKRKCPFYGVFAH